MTFLITFLEGIISFISPCVLPMIPVYIMYFSADNGDDKKHKTVINALGFVLGFSIIFIILGVFASSLGFYLAQHQKAVNIITGLIVVILGMHYAGLFKIKFLENTVKTDTKVKPKSFFEAMLFGIVFSVGWTPCVGVFLGSAIALASTQGSVMYGLLLLLCYSIGFGIPFILCAILIDTLKTTFDFIKKHYKIINTISGVFLIVIGILMMSGLFTRLSILLG